MTTSTLTPGGQVTIPDEIRERLGLTNGIQLGIEVDPDGKIVLVPERAKAQPEATDRAELSEEGLAGLVGLWDDGEELAAEVERVVANRTLPRPLNDVE